MNAVAADQRLAGALPYALILLNHAGDMLWWNEAAKRLLALNEAAVGTSVVTILKCKELKNYIKTATPVVLEIASPNESKHVLSVNILPYEDEKTLILIHDVTHTRKLEYMRQDFVANVSHELRTPLTVMRGYLEMLLDETDTRQQRVFNAMMQQTLRMQSVVADLLLLSRLETALPQNKAKQKVMVSTLAKALAAEANVLSGSRCHTILVESDDKLWLMGQEDELRSAFANLIVNAVNYTPAGGHIIIRWYQDAIGAHFSVQDTGIGIPPEHIARVTERFYRVDKARSRDSGGTGLGLAIVKHVLLRHEGKLNIESAVGKGSTFDCLFLAERVGRG